MAFHSLLNPFHKMKKHISIITFLCLLTVIGFSQTVVQMRCYFNGNEGAAQYFSINNLEEVDAPFTVDVRALSHGVHKLYVEVKDDQGIWSLYDESNVQIIGGTQMALLNAFEYFFDADPGFGEGTQIAVSDENIDTDFTLSVAGLSNGAHMLYVRVRDGAGQWSLYASKLINVMGATYDELVAAEYFLDIDPGFGNATQIPLSAFSVDDDFDISLVDVAKGVHKLFVRVLDSKGQWSLYAEHNIQVEGGIGYHELVSAEYFFDADPGFGNGLPIVLTAGTSFDENLDVAVPADLTLGQHIMYVRVQDGAGQWSLYAHDTLNVCDIIFPTITVSGGVCEGDVQALVTEEGYISYLWNTEETTSEITVAESGTYSVTVNDEDCAITVSTEVTFITLPIPTIVQDGNILYCEQDGYNYQWYLDGELLIGATTQSIEGGMEDAVYSVEISDGVCTSLPTDFNYFYNNVSDASQMVVLVYPNPASDVLFIQTNLTGITFMEVHDATGRLVLSCHSISAMDGAGGNVESLNRYQLATSNFTNGFYNLTLKNNNQLYRHIFMVMH